VREWVLQSRDGLDPRLPHRRPAPGRHPRDLRLEPEHLVAALARRVHAVNPDAVVIAESGAQRPKVMRPAERGGYGCDAAWADDFHHALRVLLTGDREGYYAEFGEVAAAGQGLPPPARPRRHVSSFRRRASVLRPTTWRRRPSWSSTPTTIRSETAPSAIGCRSKASDRSPRW
jgi:maltooligosyltrehalose trehalohydrolase